MKFKLGETVSILVNRSEVHTQEAGTVTGRAEFLRGAEPQYFVEYVDGTGCAVAKWWDESALS